MTSELSKAGSMPQRNGQNKQQRLHFDDQQIFFTKQEQTEAFSARCNWEGMQPVPKSRTKAQPRKKHWNSTDFPWEKVLGFGHHRHTKQTGQFAASFPFSLLPGQYKNLIPALPLCCPGSLSPLQGPFAEPFPVKAKGASPGLLRGRAPRPRSLSPLWRPGKPQIVRAGCWQRCPAGGAAPPCPGAAAPPRALCKRRSFARR